MWAIFHTQLTLILLKQKSLMKGRWIMCLCLVKWPQQQVPVIPLKDPGVLEGPVATKLPKTIRDKRRTNSKAASLSSAASQGSFLQQPKTCQWTAPQQKEPACRPQAASAENPLFYYFTLSFFFVRRLTGKWQNEQIQLLLVRLFYPRSTSSLHHCGVPKSPS